MILTGYEAYAEIIILIAVHKSEPFTQSSSTAAEEVVLSRPRPSPPSLLAAWLFLGTTHAQPQGSVAFLCRACAFPTSPHGSHRPSHQMPQ